MKLRRALDRIQELYPVRLGRAYAESQAANYAAGLTFNMFMSMFPLMLGLLAIVGLLLRNPEQQAQVQSALLGFFPADAQEPLRRTLTGVRDRAGLLGLIGVGGLIWSGSSLFTAMEFALGQMFGATQRNFIRQRLMALSMTALFVVAIVLAVFANAAAAIARSIPFTGPIVGAAVWIVFMLAIYRFVPNRTFSAVRQVWPGALLAGVLTEVLTLAWPVYAALTHSFTSYGATFALFFLLATWLYFLSQLILLGAVANRMRQGTPERGGAVADPNRGVADTPAARAADEQRRAAS
jgi:membrane protein